MAGFGGYFFQGMASGLQSGFNMGQMKWQQNEKKKLQKKQDEMMETSTVFNSMVSQLGEDGVYSEDDMMKINTAYMALGYEVKDRVDGTYKAIQAMDTKTIESNNQWFDLAIGTTADMNAEDAQGIFDTVRPFITGEKALKTFDAYESITKKKKEIAQKPQTVSPYDFYGQSPADVQGQIAGSVAGQTPGLEGVEFAQPQAAPQTEMDVMGETTKKLEAAYTTGNANYFNQMAKSLNVPTTFDTYKQKYEKPEAAKAAAKGKVQDPNDVLFGTNGIMKDYINTGGQLGEEQKVEIRNNYELIKPSLSADIRTQVEDYLRQIGVDVNAPAEEPIPEPEPEATQPGPLRKAWDYLTKPGGRSPAYKGNTQQGQQDYTAMSDDQVADLALTGDQAAIEELKRRGLL